MLFPFSVHLMEFGRRVYNLILSKELNVRFCALLFAHRSEKREGARYDSSET